MEYSVLQHHGVLGMKWGVRRFQNKDGTLTKIGKNRYNTDEDKFKENTPTINVQTKDRITVLKRGSTVHRVSSVSNETDKGHAFISYKEKDHAKYVNSVKAMQEVFGDSFEGYDMTLKVTKNLVAPTKKKAVDELIRAVSEDPTLKKEYAKAASKMHIFKPSSIIENQLKDAQTEKELVKIYRDISLAAAQSKDFRDKYFSKLQDQGYNSMFDGGDMDGKGVNTEAPLLVFERQGFLSVVDTNAIKI